MSKININGEVREVDVDEDTPLLWVLRDELNLTGTKFACGVSSCGACTVLVDGNAMRSCTLPVMAAKGREITTIEAVKGDIAEAIQSAWQELDVVQCGYCQSGQIMSAISLLSQNPSPSDDDIDSNMSGNVCRCATYTRIKAAIHLASENINKKQEAKA